MQIPDLAEAVIGYRAWPLDAKIMQFWNPGDNKAVCLTYGDKHDAPVHDCMCGYWAWHDVSKIDEYGPLQAAIACWGKMAVGSTRFRSEYAKIVAFQVSPFADQALANRIANYFEVPLIHSEDALVKYAAQFGGPVPETLFPNERRTQVSQGITIAPTGDFYSDLSARSLAKAIGLLAAGVSLAVAGVYLL